MPTDTQLYHLSNGIPVILSNTTNHTCKILVSLHFGACDETPLEYGITHFIEHLLSQSVTGEKNFGNLKKKIEILGGDISLYTTYNKIGCYVNILPEYLIDAIKIIAPQITHPKFNSEMIEQEKRIVLNEYRRYVATNSWFLFAQENLFRNTGLGHCLAGTPDTIQSFTPDTLSDYYHSHLSSDKFNIVVIGQINTQSQLLTELETAFGSIPLIPYTHKSWQTKPTVAHDFKQDMLHTKLVLAFPDNISDTRKNQIAIGVFRKILQDRLINTLRYKNSLIYSIQCLTMGVGNTKIYTIETEALPQTIETIVHQIALTCKNILTAEPITQTELQSAKNFIKYQNARKMDSIDKICETHAQYMNHYGDIYNIDIENTELNNLTLSEVTTAGHILLCAPLSVITQGPQKNDNLLHTWEQHFTIK